MFLKSISPISVLVLALLLPCQRLHAQGYELQTWPARQAAPKLLGTDLDGQVWRLADLRGKVVLINFWASWCGPCLAEMPALATLAASYGPNRMLVLAVNFKETAATVQRFVERSQLTLPVVRDPNGQLARAWGVTVFPTTVLVAADGRVLGLLRGEFDWQGPAAARLLAPLLAPVIETLPKTQQR